jgi:ankyrin repeat protein
MKKITVVLLWGLWAVGTLCAMNLDDATQGDTPEPPDVRCQQVVESWKKYFFDAVQFGPSDTVKVLLEFYENFGQEYNFPPIILLRDLYGRTALILAVISGSLEAVKLILDSVDIFTCFGYAEACDCSGRNAMVYADQFKYREMLTEIQSRKELSRVRLMIRYLRETFPVLTVRGKVKKLTRMCRPELEAIPEEREEKDEYDASE